MSHGQVVTQRIPAWLEMLASTHALYHQLYKSTAHTYREHIVLNNSVPSSLTYYGMLFMVNSEYIHPIYIKMFPAWYSAVLPCMPYL